MSEKTDQQVEEILRRFAKYNIKESDKMTLFEAILKAVDIADKFEIKNKELKDWLATYKKSFKIADEEIRKLKNKIRDLEENNETLASNNNILEVGFYELSEKNKKTISLLKEVMEYFDPYTVQGEKVYNNVDDFLKENNK